MITKHLLKHITGEWYLYHHIQNENALIPVAIFSFLTFFCKGGWIVSILAWFGYLVYCEYNNEKLNNDPQILIERAQWMKIRIEKGQVEEYKQILGIK